MKKKFIMLTLCFSLVFTSINYKKSYAFDFVISPTILATVVSLGVGAGIVLNKSDDIYDMGRMFVDYVKNSNDLTMDVVKTAFAGVGVMANGLVSVDSSFLDIVKGFFDNTFVDSSVVDGNIVYYGGLPYFGVHSNEQSHKDKFLNGSIINVTPGNIYVGDVLLKYFATLDDGRYMYEVGSTYVYLYPSALYKAGISLVGGVQYVRYAHIVNGSVSSVNSIAPLGVALGVSIPYVPGSYNWDKVKDRVENDKIGVAIPGNIGDLLGVPGGSTVDGSHDFPLVGDGSVTFPGVSNPSIDLEGDSVFPNVGNPSIPDVGNPSLPGVSQGVTDWIISLVVPSADYWNNKFNKYIDKIGSMLPVDIDYLKDLCVNGQPLPDFYINKDGKQMLVFSGKFANASANFIQVLFAGFTFVFLLLYNYSEVYKLIRGTRPFSTSGGGE